MKLPVLDKLRKELEDLHRELRIEIPKELQKAAAYGDLSENAEYDAVKERKVFVESRISQIQQRVSSLSSINLKSIPEDRAGFGSTLHLEDVQSGEKKIYQLVSSEEVDPENGLISIASPLGRALLGKQPGDEVKLSLPSGSKEYEITRLQTIHETFS
ncbi:MAG: transcription elongation factor GreA [Nitrospinae bacterium]|nr:transcription elongation factor GreA [Nitrospinota bacterium]